MTAAEVGLYVGGLVACYWGGLAWGYAVWFVRNLGSQA